jgi:hypothetical protein
MLGDRVHGGHVQILMQVSNGQGVTSVAGFRWIPVLLVLWTGNAGKSLTCAPFRGIFVYRRHVSSVNQLFANGPALQVVGEHDLTHGEVGNRRAVVS